MARKKVQLAYIESDSARKATYKKRTKGLLKKVDELSTLCGVDACAVIYGPYDATPEVWPNREKAEKVVTEFRQMPEMDQRRKMLNHPKYLSQRLEKSTQQLARLERENHEKEVTLAMYGCLRGQLGLEGLTAKNLKDLVGVIQKSLKEIALRLEGIELKNTEVVVGPAEEAPAPSPPQVAPGLGHLLGLGFGSPELQMQLGPTPAGWKGFDGASCSGSGDSDGDGDA